MKNFINGIRVILGAACFGYATYNAVKSVNEFFGQQNLHGDLCRDLYDSKLSIPYDESFVYKDLNRK